MSQIWIEKLRDARSEAERDEILLRDFRESVVAYDTRRRERLRDEVEEQMRALAALAFRS